MLCIVCKKSFKFSIPDQCICNDCLNKDYNTSDEAILSNIIHRYLNRYNNKVPNKALQNLIHKGVAKILSDLGINSNIKQKILMNLRKQLLEMYLAFKRELNERRKEIVRKSKQKSS